jgi:hypothetical protein
MSTLDRFKKVGGFFQLLSLIEGCSPDKQRSLLHLVALEDPGWALLVKQKALRFEKVMSWPSESLALIAPHIPDPLAATLLHCLNPALQTKWLEAFGNIRGRQIQYLSSNLNVSSGEKSSATIRLIQTIRELDYSGTVKINELDPSLNIPIKLVA